MTPAHGSTPPVSSVALGMIWAQARHRVIGAEGQMPWHLPEDLRHFRRTTGTDPVIMGRASWDALPERYRPLPGRRNIVMSSNPGFDAPGAEVASSLDDALDLVSGARSWICGGARVYAEALHRADLLVVTEIDLDAPGDRYAPEIPSTFVATSVGEWRRAENGLQYRILTYSVRRPQRESSE